MFLYLGQHPLLYFVSRCVVVGVFFFFGGKIKSLEVKDVIITSALINPFWTICHRLVYDGCVYVSGSLALAKIIVYIVFSVFTYGEISWVLHALVISVKVYVRFEFL